MEDHPSFALARPASQSKVVSFSHPFPSVRQQYCIFIVDHPSFQFARPASQSKIGAACSVDVGGELTCIMISSPIVVVVIVVVGFVVVVVVVDVVVGFSHVADLSIMSQSWLKSAETSPPHP
jgi:hypothetical protein